MSSDSGSSVKPDGDIQSQQAAATTLVSTLVTGGSRPTLKLLQSGNITVKVSSKWYELGIELLDDDQLAQLRVIAANYSDVTRQCSEMFIYWLQTHPNATWSRLVQALRTAGVKMNDVAATLEETFSGHSVTTPSSTTGAGEIPTNQQSGTSHLSKEIITKEEFKKFGNVGEAFTALQANMTKLVRKADHLIIRRACILQTKTPGGAHLPGELKTQLSTTQNVDMILDVLALSDYWSWIDVRLLETIVTASESVRAKESLENYKSVIFSKKLVDVLPHFPGKELKKKQYTRVVSKLNKDPKELTVADLLKLQAKLEVEIMDIANGASLLEQLAKGCIEVHWYIPTELVDKAFQSAALKCHKFHDMHLQYLLIGSYQVICDPLSMEDPVPPPPANATTSKEFVDHYYDYLSVNMNTAAVTKMMLSQKLIDSRLDIAASSDYQTNCLLLEAFRKMGLNQLACFIQVTEKSTAMQVAINEALQNSVLSPSTQSVAEDRNEDAVILLNQYAFAGKSLSVLIEFLDLKVQIEAILHESQSTAIIECCSSLKASEQHDIPLFTSDITNRISEETQISALLQMLSPYFTWSDHSILTEIVKACNKLNGIQLLIEFEANVDASLPLTAFPFPKLVFQMAPKQGSSHTIFAIQLELLCLKNLQDVFDMRAFILDKCEITPHTLQLLSVAQGSSTILYWMISRCVVPLVSFKVSQNLIELKQKGILYIAIYPSTILATGKAISVGPLSFFACFDNMVPLQDSRLLAAQLSQLEEIPTTLNKLQVELTETKKEVMQERLVNKITETKDLEDLLDQQSDLPSPLTVPQGDQAGSTADQELPAPVSVVDVLKYVQSQKGTLMVKLRENEAYSKFVEQQLNRKQQKCASLQKQYEELTASFKIDEIELAICDLQSSVDKLKDDFDQIKLVKEKLTEMELEESKPTGQKEIQKKDFEELHQLPKSGPLFLLKTLNKKMDNVEEWLKDLKWLQAEMAESQEKAAKLESQLKDTCNEKESLTNQLTTLKEEKTHYRMTAAQLNENLSEMESTLKLKEVEMATLKQEKRLMIKQFSERKTNQGKCEETLQQQKELIGSGKYGEVCRVAFNSKWYAGKTIHKKMLPDVTSDDYKKLMKHINAILPIAKHPNVENIEAVIQQLPIRSILFLSELFPNNLDSFIASMQGRLPNHMQIDLCQDMAEGLAFLQETGIMHSNLHSHNVLITHDPKAVIADYICPQVLTSIDGATGVQPYLAPEVIKTKQASTHSSVIFSLGVLFLQVVTGHPPHPSGELELSEPDQRRQNLREVYNTHPLLSIIQQCLRGNESNRPSAIEVVANILNAKENVQYVMSTILQGNENKKLPPLVKALQSKQYHLKWYKCADLPRRMYEASVAVDDNNVYVNAGSAPEEETENNVYHYNITTDQWNTLPPSGHVMGVLYMVDSNLSMFGGTDLVTNKIHNKVSTFNRDTNSWTSYYPNMIQKRLKLGVVTHGDHVIVMGGSHKPKVYLDSIEVMNWRQRSPWRKVSTKLPLPMWRIKPTIAGEHMLFVGYSNTRARDIRSFQLPLTAVTSSYQVASQWEEHSIAPHWDTATVPHSNPPLIIGGSDVNDVPTSDISLYNISNKSWVQVDSLTSARDCVGVATINSNTIIVIGGCSGGVGADAAMSSSLSIVEIGHIVRN